MSSQLRQVFLLSVGVLLCSSAAFGWHCGYTDGYEPFPNAVCAMLAPAHQEEPGAGDEYAMSFPIPGGGKAHMRVIQAQPPRLEFVYPGGPQRPGSQTLILEDVQPFTHEGWVGDINGDGCPDFIINFNSSGIGLAGEGTDTLFFLSHAGGFVVRGFRSLGFGLEDLVDVDGDGRFELVHTTLIAGDPDKNDRHHNYWVYSFFRIHGTKIEPDNKLERVWIQYKELPNHTPTNLLSRAQKTRLWQKQKPEIFFSLRSPRSGTATATSHASRIKTSPRSSP